MRSHAAAETREAPEERLRFRHTPTHVTSMFAGPLIPIEEWRREQAAAAATSSTATAAAVEKEEAAKAAREARILEELKKNQARRWPGC